jgi:hypothetical protein
VVIEKMNRFRLTKVEQRRYGKAFVNTTPQQKLYIQRIIKDLRKTNMG